MNDQNMETGYGCESIRKEDSHGAAYSVGHKVVEWILQPGSNGPKGPTSGLETASDF